MKNLKFLFFAFVIGVFITCEKENQPPTCSITSPNINSKFNCGDVVSIYVDAKDEDGSIKEVRFYIDGVGVSSVISFPYKYQWDTKDVQPGSHIIKIIALDDSNLESEATLNISLEQLKPEISVFAATEITFYSAILNGSINAKGANTTVTFTYKKKSSTDWISIDSNPKTVSGYSVQTVYANISNLSPGEEYIFKGKAVNSSGEVFSAEQSFKTPDFDVSPPTREVSWQVGSTIFSVNSGIEWNATKDASWLTVAKTNNATLTANYDENTEGNPRTGKITVTGTGGIEKTVTIVQSANPKLDVSPQSREVTWQGGTTNFTVNSNIEWNITVDVTWLTVNKTNNNTIIGVTYAESTTNNSRTANIKISGGGLEKIVTVIQGVKIPPEIIINPLSTEVTPVAGNTTFSVTSNVDWSIKSVSASWITATKTNNTSINLSYTTNTTTSSRSATITLTGGGIDKEVTVNQVEVILNVSPTNKEVTPVSGTTTFSVNSNVDWSIKSVSVTWLTASKASSTIINVSFNENSTTSTRSAIITLTNGIIDKTVTVTQNMPKPVVCPAITTYFPTNISCVGATLGGNITSDGGAPVTERGVVYSTSPNPTNANTKVPNGSGIGSFSMTIYGLDAKKTYYVKAYGINSAGICYGDEKSFTTPTEAVLTTATPTGATSTSVTLGGNITSDGGATVTDRGIVYATTTNPTIANTKVVIGSGTGVFSQSITGLSCGTTYYVRSYSINCAGTSYGNEVSFTLTCPLPNLYITDYTVSPTAITRLTTTVNFVCKIQIDAPGTPIERPIYFLNAPYLGIFISNNDSFSSDDYLLYEEKINFDGNLRTKTVSTSMKIPSLGIMILPGIGVTRYILYVVDYKNTLNESIENDNSKVIKVTLK